MVDFNRALKAKDVKIKCDGFVNTIEPCPNDADCYFKSNDSSLPDLPDREHFLCESCMQKLFPSITPEELEDAKVKLFGYKYRSLLKTP